MQVKVWNDNVHPYAEKFKGKMIEIPSKEYVEMEFHEATHFLGIMPPNIQVDAGGVQKPTSYKMLRIERPDAASETAPVKRTRTREVKDDTIGDRAGG